MITLSKTFLILVGVGLVGIVILLVILFKRSPSPDQQLFLYKIAQKDSAIKKEAEKSASLETQNEALREQNVWYHTRDSTLIAHYSDIQNLYKNINATLKDIPNRINRVADNRDSLRRILSED